MKKEVYLNSSSVKQITTLIVVCLVVLATTSCAPRSEKKTLTKLSFSSGAITAANLTGIMVYGKGPGDQAIGIKLNSATDTRSIQLANGSWDFMAVAWEGGPDPMSGNIRCGTTSGIGLSGTDVTVTINVTKEGCANPAFGPEISKSKNNQVLSLKVHTCINPKAVLYADGWDCKGGKVSSVKVRLPEFIGSLTNKQLLPPDKGLSVCKAIDAHPDGLAPNSADTGIRVPLFDLNYAAPIPVIVETYEGANCTGTFETYSFIDGLTDHFNNDYQSVFIIENRVNIFTRHNYCTGAQLGGSPFANGLFNSSYNYICTATQLDNLIKTTDATHLGSSAFYMLAQNIDMSSVGAVSEGIGNGPTAFVGKFDGLGNSISNLNINHSGNSANGIGLFNQLANGASIQNLTIIDPTIQSNASGSAVLVGKIPNASNVSIEDILIEGDYSATNAIFNGTSQLNKGILIGSASDFMSFKDIEIRNIRVQDFGNTSSSGSFGFFAGYIYKYSTSPSHVENVLIENVIYTNGNPQSGVPPTYFGGFAGALKTDGNPNRSLKIRGVVVSDLVMNLNNANQVGGLVGSMSIGNFVNFSVHGQINLGSGGSINTNIGGGFGHISQGVANSDVRLIWGKSDFTITSAGSTQTDNGLMIGGVTHTSTSVLELKSLHSNNGTLSCTSGCASTGGLIGRFESSAPVTIEDIHVTGANISASAGITGGIVGEFVSSNVSLIVDRCSFDGSISGGSGSVGGIVGSAVNSNVLNTINHCLVKGVISGPNKGAAVYDAGGPTDISFNNTIVDINADTINFAGTGTLATSSNNFKPSSNPQPTGMTGFNTSISYSSNIGGTFVWGTIWIERVGSTPELFELSILNQIGGMKAGMKFDPYYLSTADHLAALSNYPPLFDKHFELIADIDFDFLSGSLDFIPIGSVSSPFTGKLLGNDFTISNLYLDNTDNQGNDNVGLFGVLGAGAVIGDSEYGGIAKGLFLHNFYLETSGNNVGALAGSINVGGGEIQSVRVTDVYIDCDDEVNYGINGGNFIGGLIGSVSIDTSGQSDYSRISFLINLSCKVTGNMNVGGIIGGMDFGITDSNPRTIEYLFNYGNVETNSGLSGGILGLLANQPTGQNFQFIANYGDVFDPNSGAVDMAGLIGKVTGVRSMSINDAYVLSNITGGSQGIGGIIGTASGTPVNITIFNSVYIGAISASGGSSTNTGLFIGYLFDASSNLLIGDAFGFATDVATKTLLPAGSNSNQILSLNNNLLNFRTAVNLTSTLPGDMTRFTDAQMLNPTELNSVSGYDGFVTPPGELPRLWFENIFLGQPFYLGY